MCSFSTQGGKSDEPKQQANFCAALVLEALIWGGKTLAAKASDGLDVTTHRHPQTPMRRVATQRLAVGRWGLIEGCCCAGGAREAWWVHGGAGAAG